MSAEPLTREERDFILREPYRTGKESPGAAFSRYEASVQAAEEQRDQAENDRDVARLEANAAEERADRLRAALGAVKYTEGDARPIARAALAADDAARGDR